MSDDFIADKVMDISALDDKDSSYDLIICYHILEHVIQDEKAILELYRVLKSNGTCLIQTPFKAGPIYEDFSIVGEEDRLAHFGQEDHVRIYSVDGLKERLINAGFTVEIRTFVETEQNRFGYHEEETVLVCRKK